MTGLLDQPGAAEHRFVKGADVGGGRGGGGAPLRFGRGRQRLRQAPHVQRAGRGGVVGLVRGRGNGEPGGGGRGGRGVAAPSRGRGPAVAAQLRRVRRVRRIGRGRQCGGASGTGT